MRTLEEIEKSRAVTAGPNNSVTCGRYILTDPDPGIRASFLRDCGHFERPGN